jgi:hypothetical protein
MLRAKQIVMAGGTFSVALGIGFVMQNGDALAGRFTDDTAAPTVLSQPLIVAMPQVPVGRLPVGPLDMSMPAVTLAAEPVAPALPAPIAIPHSPMVTGMALPDDMAAPSFSPDQVELAAVEATPTVSDALPVAPAEPVAANPVCDASLTATLAPAAMVELALKAPCAPDATVVIHHQGMMFTVVTDSDGLAGVRVPALAETAVFVAELGGGAGVAASIMVPDLVKFDRAVLQWQGQGGMELHALEFGATYGDAGHVWSGAARDAATALSGTGGFMTRLGNGSADTALIAEVYTFPSGTTTLDGTVDLSVEAEVTSANCGRDVAAQSIQIVPGTDTSVVDLTMTMPACDAVGEFLVLNNMLQDLTLAAK